MSDRFDLTSRRRLLLGGGALFGWSMLPKIAQASGRDPRLLVIVLRGALDGLATVAPVGDPQWKQLRGDEALKVDGTPGALALDSFFALNPAMPNLHRLFRKSQALVVHACSTPYRERSHFDGQDVLESGLSKAGAGETGWLNRAVSSLESGGRVNPERAVAVGPVTPLIVRGPAPVLIWTPPQAPVTSDDTINRLLDLYRSNDPELARLMEERLGVLKASGTSSEPVDMKRKLAKGRDFFVESAGTAAKFLSKADGPRVGALGLYGWDTHAHEGALTGRLAGLLGGLDGAIAAIEKESGPAWKDMVVVIVTEFGRTVLINGTGGTDHGTASAALLVGGAVKGGRIVADWPGLKTADLYEGRDLKPTIDLRAVFKGVLKDHMGVDATILSSKVFPDSGAIKPMDGLIG